tara:strand:- start:2354 stop:2635 length:282 start_codon:yes stop_codon:yes gene_type:complete
MFKKIKLLIYFLFIIIFIGYTYYIYFSEDIVTKINKNRYNYSEIVNDNSRNLKILRNDTQNIIIYNIEKTNDQKIKKRQFWNLLKDEEKSSNN